MVLKSNRKHKQHKSTNQKCYSQCWHNWSYHSFIQSESKMKELHAECHFINSDSKGGNALSPVWKLYPTDLMIPVVSMLFYRSLLFWQHITKRERGWCGATKQWAYLLLGGYIRCFSPAKWPCLPHLHLHITPKLCGGLQLWPHWRLAYLQAGWVVKCVFTTWLALLHSGADCWNNLSLGDASIIFGTQVLQNLVS